ncbi:hypothetical protein H0H92_007848 [Tricholoma furcatifolium]|nr:hypothetical protein H0H92_007848 [Tricholoma furcatifolium]
MLRLPLDILDEIVQFIFLEGDKNVKRTLSACAAVADRTLGPRVQRLLFTDISLNTVEDFRTLCSLFESNPSLAKYIRILRIPHTTPREVDTHIDELTSILGAVSNLQHFQSIFLDHQHFTAFPRSFKDALSDRFRTVSSLVLEGIIYLHLQELTEYQGLQALHIHELLPFKKLDSEPTVPSYKCKQGYLDRHLRRQALFPLHMYRIINILNISVLSPHLTF